MSKVNKQNQVLESYLADLFTEPKPCSAADGPDTVVATEVVNFTAKAEISQENGFTGNPEVTHDESAALHSLEKKSTVQELLDEVEPALQVETAPESETNASQSIALDVYDLDDDKPNVDGLVDVDIAGLLSDVPEYSTLETAHFVEPELSGLYKPAGLLSTNKNAVVDALKSALSTKSLSTTAAESTSVVESPSTDLQQDVGLCVQTEARPSIVLKDAQNLNFEGYLSEDPLTQEPFQTLLFQLGGLELAVPLAKLGGIHPLEVANITTLFGKPSWYMGMVKHELGNINVVNTARWIMSDRFSEGEIEELDQNYVILLGSSRWGLSCSKVKDTIVLGPEQVKWNRNPKKRRWLGGLLIEQMCALLDVNTLIRELSQTIDGELS